MKMTSKIILFLGLGFFFFLGSQLRAEFHNVYFGTHGKGSDGIYHATFNDKNGKLSSPRLANELRSPSFLAKHPNLNVIYAVIGGDESIHALEPQGDGSLKTINSSPIGDGRSAHISVHPSGNFLITAQYRNGSVGVFPIDASGKVMSRTQLFKHQGGSKVFPKRQDTPHPHWTGFSPDGRFAMVPDLGMDQIIIYKVDLESNTLKQHGKATPPPGSGPRHMRFSTDGRFIYLLNELSMTISTFSYDSQEGSTIFINSTKTLKDEVKNKQAFNAASEILVHPKGHFLYSANRGHDSVSVYQVTPSNGTIRAMEVESVRGSWPRSIALDPSGRWLLAAGQFSNSVATFAIDEDSGELTFVNRETASLPRPSCILFP
jgi:6-phosphogluconolactonase